MGQKWKTECEQGDVQKCKRLGSAGVLLVRLNQKSARYACWQCRGMHQCGNLLNRMTIESALVHSYSDEP